MSFQERNLFFFCFVVFAKNLNQTKTQNFESIPISTKTYCNLINELNNITTNNNKNINNNNNNSNKNNNIIITKQTFLELFIDKGVLLVLELNPHTTLKVSVSLPGVTFVLLLKNKQVIRHHHNHYYHHQD